MTFREWLIDKVRRCAGRYYVQCYREDETPERRRTIEQVNRLLSRYRPQQKEVIRGSH